MAVKRKYRLNLRNYGNLPAIMLSQYDEGYALEFEIRDGTDAASDLSDYTVTLKGTRADTLAYSFAGTVSTNVLTFVIDTTMTACAGRGTAEIAIKDTANDVLFATFNMPVFVERAAVPEGSIDADVERAQEIAEEVEELIDGATEGAEAWAVGQRGGVDVESTDETYHNNAKYYAEQAADSAASIGIDATLTQVGKAADAKKTGDEIDALKEDLNAVCGVTFTPNLIDNTYYSGAVGDTISTNSNSLSQAYTAVDLSDYVGKKVVVTYASKKTTTRRKTAMCNSSGVIGYVDSELKAENVFDITEDYPYLYVSCSDNNLSSIKTTCLIDDLSDDVDTLDTRVDALETGQAEVQSWLGASFTPVLGTDNAYYTGDVGDTISTTTNSTSQAFAAIDLSSYIGRKVTVTYASKMTVSNRKTVMCNSNGVIGYVDTEKNLTNIFEITESYPYLYISCKDNNLSAVTVNSAIDVIEGDIDTLTPLSNPYSGMKYAALGDSITYGFRPRNDTTDSSPIKSYAALVAERLGMTFYNHGISASTVAYDADHNPMSRRWDDIPDDADIITVMGGANDIRQSIPVGTMSDRTDATFYGALHVIFNGLYKKFYIDQGATVGKRKKIIAITPLKLMRSGHSASEIGGDGELSALEPYVQAFKDVAAYYSCPCLDMYNLSQLNPSICCTVQGTDANASGIYTIYQPDGVHPTQAAAEMMADLFEGFLLSLK